MTRPKIIIVGGGFGGLSVAKNLKKASADILLIDKTNHHLFQPLLYQVATAALSPGNIAAPIRFVLKKQKNVQVILGEVQSIDKKAQTLTLKDGQQYPFDFLVLAPGARHSYFGQDHWEKFAPGLKTIQDALKIREQMLLSFERAERAIDQTEQKKLLTFVVIGAGPTGVEMAGAIAEIAQKTLQEEFRTINLSETKVLLIDAAERILPAYHPTLSEKAFESLKALGVEIKLQAKVNQITANKVQIGTEWIETENIIWAAGNKASPLLKTLEIELDRAGRALVQTDLSIPEFSNIFVLGDAAHFKSNQGEPLPGIAPVALQQGIFIGALLAKELKQQKAERPIFRYRDRGMMATIGRAKAVAHIYSFRFSGWLAWLAWSFIHILFLIDYRNRLIVMMEWMWNYFTYHRTARLITQTEKKPTPPEEI